MLQRKLTRIELKPDDAKEFESFWKDLTQKRKQELQNASGHPTPSHNDSANTPHKTVSELVRERIGYHVKPQTTEGQALLK
uniref:Anaphase-promoting complex subunit CDC26 n=1 Tax=Romanomermis culicivorax TaxID=13658 RepID=A0A915K6L2_ROMCU